MPSRSIYGVTEKRGNEKRAILRGLTVALLFARVLSGIGPHAAMAGTYVMRNCEVPGHRASPMLPWHVGPDIYDNTSITDGCATGAGVSFGFSGSRTVYPSAFLHIELSKPRGARSSIELV